MRVLLSRSAARALFAEVARWVEHGLQTTGSPMESLLYPLAAMTPAGDPRCPLELTGVEHVEELVLDHVAIPPDTVKAYTAHNCHFEARDLSRINDQFNRTIDALLARRPRLAVLSKLHAHPFEGGDFISAGDRYHGITSPEAVRWRQRRGLRSAVLHVVYPDRQPRLDTDAWRIDQLGALGAGARWRVGTWASTEADVLRLEPAEVVSSRHPSVRAARRAPYWATRAGSRWCDAQKRALRDAGYRCSRNLLGRGWRRYIVDLAGGEQLLLALPPDLPAARPRVLRIVRAMDDLFEPLELPPRLLPHRLSQLSLPALVQHLAPPP